MVERIVRNPETGQAARWDQATRQWQIISEDEAQRRESSSIERFGGAAAEALPLLGDMAAAGLTYLPQRGMQAYEDLAESQGLPTANLGRQLQEQVREPALQSLGNRLERMEQRGTAGAFGELVGQLPLDILTAGTARVYSPAAKGAARAALRREASGGANGIIRRAETLTGADRPGPVAFDPTRGDLSRGAGGQSGAAAAGYQGRFRQGMRDMLTPERDPAADAAAREAGFQEPASVFAGEGRVREQMRMIQESTPGLNVAAARGRERKLDELTGVVRQTLGVDVEDLGRMNLPEVERQLGGRFEAVLGKMTQEQASTAAMRLARQADEVLQTVDPALEGYAQLRRTVQSVLEKGTRPEGITPRNLKSLRTQISDMSWRNRGDSEASEAFRQLRDQFDNIFEDVAGPDLAAEYAEARRAWAYFEAMRGGQGTVTNAAGQINPKSFLNALERNLGRNRDRDQAYRMASYLERYESTGPDSGTATRQLLNNVIIGGAAGGTGAVGSLLF
jgi:hypothetical protein